MENRVIKNVSWIVLCKIIQSVLSLIVGSITARYLGPSNYGVINYVASIMAFMVPIMQLGFRNTLVQEYIKNPDEEGKTLGTALFMNSISAIFCMVCVVCFVFFTSKGDNEVVIVCALYSTSLLFQALEMTQYWFQAKLLSKYTAVVSVVAYIMMSIYRIVLLICRKNIYWFAVSQTLDFLIISLAQIIIFIIIGNQKIQVSICKGKAMFSTSKYYIVSSMMVAIFGYIGNVFLKFLVNEEAVGYYTAAVTCAGVFNFLFAAIIDSARPVVLYSKGTDTPSFEKKMTQLYSIIILLTLLQCCGQTIFAKVLVQLLYGSEYMNAVVPLRIYTWQAIFSQIGTVRNIWILAENKQKYLWIINSVGALSSIILNFTLIPIAGLLGAAISAVITQFFTNVILGFIIKPIRRNNRLLINAVEWRTMRDSAKTCISRVLGS